MTRRNTCDAMFAGCLVCATALLAGCQTLAQGPAGDVSGVSSTSPVAEVPRDTTLTDKTKKSADQVMRFVTGREQESVPRAKRFYQEADGLFRQAGSQPKDQATKTYRASAKLFRKAGEAAPGSALEQDALFMQGESLFFADRLTDATEAYQKLQKEYPRSRHNDRVAARLFAISRYWIDTVVAREGSWFNVNFTDPKKPRLDVDGHAIRVLDQIRYDDPTGRLADDATMAAAAEYIRQEKFEEADEFLTDLRETFSDSNHFFLAHLMGIQCKLKVYEGPRYSGLVLEEAEKLVRQTRQRFPQQLKNPKYGEIVAKASAEIAYLQADRWIQRADYREKRKEYGAARFCYQQLLNLHGQTPQADRARQRLAAIEQLPAVPTRRLAWLTTFFPESRRSDPLQTTGTDGSESPDQSEPKTLLR